MERCDHIVVGSGCTGAMAAQTLVEAGANVTMLDVGLTDEKYARLIPPVAFCKARETDDMQHRYLLGDDFEMLHESAIVTGVQLTAPRMHMAKQVQEALTSDSFAPLESFAYGGLGSGWGLGCCMFSAGELQRCGLDARTMTDAYRVIADRIGVSGARDDVADYTCGALDNLMPSIHTDNNGAALAETYRRKRTSLNKNGFFLGRPSLALITRDKDGRKAYAYRDLDFYSDADKSAYRPWITVDRLKTQHNFRYIRNSVVLGFEEIPRGVKVHVYDVARKEHVWLQCTTLVLAPGVLQTARIVMRSLGGQRLPLLCNPHGYIPSVQWSMLGKQLGDRKIGFAQHSLFHDESGTNDDVAMASVYSYHSLMMFRVIREARLNFRDARVLMQYLLPAFTIFGIHHPASAGPGKYLDREAHASSLTGDSLSAAYELSADEKEQRRQRERKYLRAIRLLGCFAIKIVDPGMGSSIHYAGTLPFDDEGKAFTISSTGRLNGTRNVFVADGSGFKYLPAKGLTFSLMANAHNAALNSLRRD